MTMATKTFRGEGDLMVDALVAASQAAYANPNGGQPMPGFGRDLVPFFDDLGQEAGAANGAPAPAPAPQAQKKAKAPKPNKGGKKTAAVPAPKGVLTKGGMTYVQQQPNAAVAQAATCSPTNSSLLKTISPDAKTMLGMRSLKVTSGTLGKGASLGQAHCTAMVARVKTTKIVTLAKIWFTGGKQPELSLVRARAQHQTTHKARHSTRCSQAMSREQRQDQGEQRLP